MLKVLHVISGDLWAGAEVMACSLMSRLVQDGDIDIKAVVLNEGKLAEALRSGGVPTEVLDESVLTSAALFSRLRRLVRDYDPDIVHTHGYKENVLGGLVAAMLRKKSVRTSHGWHEFSVPVYRLDKRAYSAMDRFVGRRLQQRIVAVSPELATKLETQFAASDICVISNGVDVDAVRRDASSPSTIPVVAGKKNVGIVARLVPVKRHDRFVDAARILLDRNPGRYDFHVIGDGPLADKVASHVEKLQLGENIHLHGFQAHVPAILRSLDCLVVCSEHEGLPMNVLEAGVLGLPVVTVPLPSIAQVLENGVAGTVGDDESPAGLARAIEAGLELPREATWSDVADGLYSSRAMARRYAELYRDVTGI